MKRIAICCDGTWNKATQAFPTNVAKTKSAIAPIGNGVEQLAFYDSGVGTGGLFDKVLGGITGRGLEQNVHDAYRYLVEHYNAGDEIFFFGFSRGAYTARSTAGMIRKCGILRRDEISRIKEAYDLYKNAGIHPDSDQAKSFRHDYSVL